VLQRRIWHSFTQAHGFLYRLSGGRLGGTFRGAPVLLLQHIGRKTGHNRTSPLLYLSDGDDLVIVASNGGSRRHPVWWLNLREHPSTTVEVGSDKRAVVARQASAEEKARLWPRLVEIYAPYADYQKRTSREIPVVVLERARG
jgi:deazaflavin-dependent oxidoreductase (nitroreductase family)